MSSPNFPSTGLVPNETKFTVGALTYLWDGEKWRTITAKLSADQITYEGVKNVKEQVSENNDVIRSLLTAQGLSGNYGFFEDGFNYQFAGDVGIDPEGVMWTYAGAGAPVKVVAAGTVPSVSAGYEQVVLNTAENIKMSSGESVQDFKDNLDTTQIKHDDSTAYKEIQSLLKTQKQPSIVEKMRDLGRPSFNYIRSSSGVIYVGCVFGGSPYMPVDSSTYLTGTEWRFSTNSDNLLLMTGGFSGDAAQEYIVQPEISLDGTFILSAPNAYTVTVGDKFTGTTTGSKIVLFKHYADNRGGVWKFTTNTGMESEISTYNVTSNIVTDVIFDNLDASQLYTITAEYMGDDPLNPPTGGTSRGWLYYEVGNASVQPFVSLEFLGITNEVPLSATGSVNDFAVSARYSGSGSSYNWVPQHNRSGVSTDVITKIYVDGAVLSNSSIAPDSGIKEIESFSIQARFKARNSNTPSTVLWTHYVTHSVADGVLSINNRMEFISETDVSVAYLALVGADASKVNRIVYSSGMEMTTSIDNTNNFFSNSTSGVMYSGTFDEAKGIYHGLGCDVDVYSSCAIGTQLEDDKINYQTFRDDNVNKTYWLCASGKIVPPGTVIKSNASHYMMNGVRSPNLDIGSI